MSTTRLEQIYCGRRQRSSVFTNSQTDSLEESDCALRTPGCATSHLPAIQQCDRATFPPVYCVPGPQESCRRCAHYFVFSHSPDSAVAYTCKGIIDIAVTANGVRALIQICDEGPEITPKDTPSIVEQSYRADSSRNTIAASRIWAGSGAWVDPFARRSNRSRQPFGRWRSFHGNASHADACRHRSRRLLTTCWGSRPRPMRRAGRIGRSSDHANHGLL